MMEHGVTTAIQTPLLDTIHSPDDLRTLSDANLALLAHELRSETIRTVSKTGGHLGSSLGVVEITVAIHAVFDTPRDKLIWDVGHQCYPHKILTGRRDRMISLRQGGGLSGFTRRAESDYDPFGAAHSSTSMSAGLGFAMAAELGGQGGDVVCVVGDGAMSAGMAYEAINNIGALGRRIFVILNDNGMSIAPPVGAFSQHLTRLCERRAVSRKRNRRLGSAGSKGRARRNRREAGEVGTALFEQLGFTYLGPIDGHDMAAVLATLRDARANADGPVLIHAKTRKGAGYAPAETSADKYHGVSRFDVVTGKQAKSAAGAPSYTRVFADALINRARLDKRIVAVTAAMPSGTGIDLFATEFPTRSFDVGIAEQHAVTFCAGMAAGGMRPFCAIYSTFLQRAYDQVVHDVALQGLPVRFAIDRAGLVGADGPTHAGAFDIGYLANLPGFTVMAASDEAELVDMVATAAELDTGPCAFRFPRGSGTGAPLPEYGRPLEIGKGRIVREGRTVAILSFGARLGVCMGASQLLERMGIVPTVADARFAKPLDTALIEELVAKHEVLITIEEGATGGFGALVLHHLAGQGLLGGCAVRTMTLPDRFIPQDSSDAMYAAAALTADNVVQTALAALAGNRDAPAGRAERVAVLS